MTWFMARTSRTIACVGVDCSAQALDVGSTVGDTERTTEFVPFFCNDGGLQWICPVCWSKLLPAFELLDAVLGRRAAFEPIDILVRRWKKEPGGPER